MEYRTQDPSADLDYAVDWSKVAKGSKVAWLQDGDTIISSSWAVDPVEEDGGLELHSESATATTTRVWIRGGVEGHTYTVTNLVESAAGRVDERTVLRLSIRDR